MDTQQIISIINEAVQKAVPAIVEEVTQKLNSKETLTQRQQWENLTYDDILKLSVSKDFRDRCRAATHPKVTDSILRFLENDHDCRVRRAVKSVRFQNFINTAKGVSDYTNIIENGVTKTERKIARDYLEQELLSGNLDDELDTNDSRKIFSSVIPNSKLIEFSKSKDPYTSYYAGLMIKYRFLNFVGKTEINEIVLLSYAFGKNDCWGIIKNHE